LRQITGREFARLLERHGWQLLRITGSHHIFGKRGNNLRISVPIHASRSLKTGLLRRLAKLGEIPEDELR